MYINVVYVHKCSICRTCHTGPPRLRGERPPPRSTAPSQPVPACAPASNRLFQALDFYWRAPELGGVRYKSLHFKKKICDFAERGLDPEAQPLRGQFQRAHLHRWGGITWRGSRSASRWTRCTTGKSRKSELEAVRALLKVMEEVLEVVKALSPPSTPTPSTRSSNSSGAARARSTSGSMSCAWTRSIQSRYRPTPKHSPFAASSSVRTCTEILLYINVVYVHFCSMCTLYINVVYVHKCSICTSTPKHSPFAASSSVRTCRERVL